MNFTFMTRHARDMPIEMDSDSEFVHSSHHPRNGFDLDGDASGRQPGNLTDQHNSNEPHYTSVYELARPIWPANDVVTPAISERKIRRLECGNDDEKLMAAFARHVINPNRNRRPGTRWVSHRSLRKAFAEHFDQTGFLAESSWKDKTAGDFGLPDLFFRTVDDGKAWLGPNESVDDLIEDLGRAPALHALTAEEYEQLQNRVTLNEKHSASITTDQPQSFDTSNQSGQSLQGEGGLNTTKNGRDIPRPSKRLRSMSSAKSQFGDKTRRPPVLGPGWVRVTPDRMSPPGTKPRVSPKTKHSTPLHALGLSTPNTDSLENNNTHAASQQRSDQRLSAKPRTMHEHRPKPLQQDQADITDSEGQSKAPRSSSPAANEMRAVKTILIPKIGDILKDFPTAPEDESFPPLLRQLVTATVANTPQAIEERHLDLLTYVVTHCTSSSPTDQVKPASLVRPILKILSRHRQNLAGQTHSQIQRDINAAARANDLNWLRVLHAELLLFEAQHDGDQNGQ
ncbi:hypothetical protein KCU98_g13394, partial [Aureobasidium melanogenum]